ncbi:hypothetical protein ACIBL8_48435 [Streptomyces sp. NPDC050523]|uniref:hypothetical protein n=1 Tax=Streptomyces sp. NPDC050523 TaxID=3365622 RepID=UPI0037A224AA
MTSTFRAKSAVVAATFVAGTVLLTGCHGTATGAVSSSKSDAPTASQKAGKGKSKKIKKVSGTFTGGTVEYLAPGKPIVNAHGRHQQFFVSENTKIYGAGTICGQPNIAADTVCTAADLDKALKAGAVPADVIIKNGIAIRVTERSASNTGGPTNGGETGGGSDGPGKAVNGTWFGNVMYLAPGEYTVSDAKGGLQAFFVTADTKVFGWGHICGDKDGADDQPGGGTPCTEDELEAATKHGGVSAKVILVNGTASVIADDH